MEGCGSAVYNLLRLHFYSSVYLYFDTPHAWPQGLEAINRLNADPVKARNLRGLYLIRPPRAEFLPNCNNLTDMHVTFARHTTAVNSFGRLNAPKPVSFSSVVIFQTALLRALSRRSLLLIPCILTGGRKFG
jgi:hypothetical protein